MAIHNIEMCFILTEAPVSNDSGRGLQMTHSLRMYQSPWGQVSSRFWTF